MNWFQSLILGIVQGLTEFLPISSTAHLRIIPSLLHWNDPGTEYSAIIQLGTMFSVICFFYKDLKKIYFSLLVNLIEGHFKIKNWSFDSRLALWILIGTIPISITGLVLKDQLEAGIFRNLNLISFYLIFFGIILFISENLSKKNKEISSLTLLDVLLIGITQTFALIPGASRSGVTIIAGLLLGLKRKDAARFSFLLGVPAILASGLLEFFSLTSSIKSGIEINMQINLLIGLVSAFISGYWSIDFLLKYLQSHKTYVFIFYRIFLALIVIYLNFYGFIK